MNEKRALLEKDLITIANMEVQTVEFLKHCVRKHRIFNNNNNKYFKKFFLLHHGLCQIWEVQFKFHYDPNDLKNYVKTGGGKFSPSEMSIHLYHPSLIVYLHEFKHGLQLVYPFYTLLKDREKDARSWSVTIFKLSFPRVFKKIVEEKKIFCIQTETFPLVACKMGLLKGSVDFS